MVKKIVPQPYVIAEPPRLTPRETLDMNLREKEWEIGQPYGAQSYRRGYKSREEHLNVVEPKPRLQDDLTFGRKPAGYKRVI